MKYVILGFIFAFCYMNVSAQGVRIYKKDKTTFSVAYTEIDSIVVSEEADVRWVDLGLPSGLLWASCNIGASSPEDYGDYFAWGEISPKSSYDESNSIARSNRMKNFSNLAQYDAATANWGAPVRMPNKAEIEELINYCTTTWTTQNGVNGRLVTGPNGNSIFLPATGYRCGNSLYGAGEQGCYWSISNPNPTTNTGEADALGFGRDEIDSYGNSCDSGRAVRPVREK